MKRITTFFVFVFILGCGKESITPPELQLAKTDDPFELKIGQSATLNDGFTFTFDSVPSDSRCPKNVVCIWQGNAAIILKFSDASDTLNTISPQPIVYGAYTIKLIALSPYPEYPQDIPKDAYIVKLVVTKS